jgi:hypothetical protein
MFVFLLLFLFAFFLCRCMTRCREHQSAINQFFLLRKATIFIATQRAICLILLATGRHYDKAITRRLALCRVVASDNATSKSVTYQPS